MQKDILVRRRQYNIVVDFNDGARASFSAGDLLVLRNINEIERNAANGATLLFNEDCQDIMGVIPFMHMPETACQKLAIELARTNSMALEYAMHSLENELGLKRNYAISR